MNKKRRRSNPLLIILLAGAIIFLVYFNVMVVPGMNPPFVPTPTETRDPVSYEIEAQNLATEGKFIAAIEAYQQAINANPKKIENYLNIARLQIYSGAYAQAQVSAENAVLLENDNPEAYALLGWAKGMQQNYLEGEKDAKTAISLNPNSALAHAVYAYILALRVEAGLNELDTMDLAIEESRTALALDANLLEARWARGYVLEITSNYADAAEQYQIAVQLNSNIAQLHLALGAITWLWGKTMKPSLSLQKPTLSIQPTRCLTILSPGCMAAWVNGLKQFNMERMLSEMDLQRHFSMLT